MGMIPLGLIFKVVIGLAIAGAVFAGYKYVDGRLEHHYADPVRAAWKASDDKRIAFQTALTLALSGKLMEAKDAAARVQREVDARFSGLATRAGGLPPAAVAVSGAAARLFDDAASAANAGRAGADAGAKTGAEPVPAATEGQVRYDEREFAAWIVAAAASYADAYGLWRACRDREDRYLVAFSRGASP